MIRGDRGSALEGLTIRVGARRTLEDAVAVRRESAMEECRNATGYTGIQ